MQSVPDVLILLMSLPSIPKQCWIVSASSETFRRIYYLMQWEVRKLEAILSCFIQYLHMKKIVGQVKYYNLINLVEDQIIPLFLIHRRMLFYTHENIPDIFFC